MRWILKCIGWALLFAVFALALAWVTMLLWNWLVPALFGGPVIKYLEAAGLMILGRLLVGGFHRGGCHGHRHWKHHHHGYWKRRWEEKMANMTPEEREKFKMGMSKCGPWGRWSDCDAEPDKPENP